jgi:hypothetical protein
MARSYPAVDGSITPSAGTYQDMLTLLLIVLVVVLLLGGIGGPRYYRGRGRRTVVREYDTDL